MKQNRRWNQKKKKTKSDPKTHKINFEFIKKNKEKEVKLKGRTTVKDSPGYHDFFF
jgi:hypothetical protein